MHITIILEFFEKHKIPVVSTATASRGHGFRIERYDYIDASFRQSIKRGFKRPALICCGYPYTEQTLNTFRKYTDLPEETYCYLLNQTITTTDNSIFTRENFIPWLEKLAALPKTKRPDVLIVPDDILMSFIFPYLQQKWCTGCDWKPFFIYIRHKQVPILPSQLIQGDYFEFDITKTAEITVSFLLDVIRGKETEPRSIVVEPELFEYK